MKATRKKIDEQVKLIEDAFAEFTPGLNIPFDQSANYFISAEQIREWLAKRKEEGK